MARVFEVWKRRHLSCLGSGPIAHSVKTHLTLYFGSKDIHWALAALKVRSTRQLNRSSALFHLNWYGVQICGETGANRARQGAADKRDRHVDLKGLTQTAKKSEAFRSNIDS